MPAIKAEVLFGVYKVFLIIRCSNAVWFLHSTPGSWEGIDLHRDCTYSTLSKGNEAQQTAIFFRDVFLCLCVFVWVFFFFFWLFGILKLMLERDCTASTGCLTVIINYLLNVMACLTARSLSSGFVAMLKWVHSSPPPQVLKGSKKLCLSVRSVGRIPGGYVTNHVYTWVDPQGRSVSPPPDLSEHRSATLRRTDSQRRSNMQLLQEGDEKKVRSCPSLL